MREPNSKVKGKFCLRDELSGKESKKPSKHHPVGSAARVEKRKEKRKEKEKRRKRRGIKAVRINRERKI